MFGSFFSKLKAGNTNKPTPAETPLSRRQYVRRSCDKSVAVINGQIYPVEDWSMGGLAINGDSRDFGINDRADMILKFRLSNDIIDLQHTARVVRKSAHRIAFEFMPLPDDIKNGFQHVVDDYVSSRFADSQFAS